MSKSTFEENLEARADLFKALGHPARMLIVNLIRMKPRHGEELAAILKLKPATISHHLAKLSQAGLVTSRKDQYYQTYSIVPALLKKSLSFTDVISQASPDPAPCWMSATRTVPFSVPSLFHSSKPCIPSSASK